MTDPTAIAADIFDAFNQRDVDALMAYLHPDYEVTWAHGTLAGAEAAAYDATILDALPDVRARIDVVHDAGNHVIVEVVMEGTHTGALVTPEGPVIPSSGRRWIAPMVAVMAFEDGLLRRERIYVDRFAPIASTCALSVSRLVDTSSVD